MFAAYCVYVGVKEKIARKPFDVTDGRASFQLVSRIGDESPQLGHRRLDPLEKAIEGQRQPPELIVGVNHLQTMRPGRRGLRGRRQAVGRPRGQGPATGMR